MRRYYAEAIHQYTTNRGQHHSNTRIGDVMHGSNSLSNSEDDDDDDEFGQGKLNT